MEQSDLPSERTWLTAFFGAIATFVVGSLALPGLVYDRFIWQYFWGPIYADAQNVRCAVKTGAGIELGGSSSQCATLGDGGVVAYTGYTLVSEIGYMVTLLFMLVGVILLLKRLELTLDKQLFLALMPFMPLGGALRVVEDLSNALTEPLIGYPLNTLFISPIIYVTIFVLTLGSLLASRELEKRDVVDSYHRSLAAIGTGMVVLTILFLFWQAFVTDGTQVQDRYANFGFHLDFFLTTLVLSTVFAVAIYYVIDRNWPKIHRGTGVAGLVVLWAHAVDGVANVIASDWVTRVFGFEYGYTAKHPVDAILAGVVTGVLPESVWQATGDSWLFLVVKLAVATGILVLFDDEFIDESTQYAFLLLVAATAVGLGPGTRDTIRATLGI